MARSSSRTGHRARSYELRELSQWSAGQILLGAGSNLLSLCNLGLCQSQHFLLENDDSLGKEAPLLHERASDNTMRWTRSDMWVHPN